MKGDIDAFLDGPIVDVQAVVGGADGLEEEPSDVERLALRGVVHVLGGVGDGQGVIGGVAGGAGQHGHGVVVEIIFHPDLRPLKESA